MPKERNISTLHGRRDIRFFRFLLDACRILLARPWLLMLSVACQIGYNSLEPALSLIIKRVTSLIEKGPVQGDLGSALAQQAPLYLSIVASLCLLKLATGWSKGVLDSSIVLTLQSRYLQRRTIENPREDVSRMMFDCLEAKRALDPLHFDLWRNSPRLISVIFWQINLAPAWLPMLMIVTGPHLLSIAIFTPLQQRARAAMLRTNSLVARSSHADGSRLRGHQKKLLRKWGFLHFWTGSMNAVMEWAGWPTFVIVYLLSQRYNLGILPAEIKISDLAVFAFNMREVGLPVRELGMIYTKIRGYWPAVIRVLYPCKPDFSIPRQNKLTPTISMKEATI